jgi:regulator of sirC expression with transglutaminase-like and TPR domain
MNDNIKAMITLLDDTDNEVVAIVEDQLRKIGVEVIPVLENEWENNGLNPVLQKKIEDLIHEMQFKKLFDALSDWKKNNDAELLEGLWLIATYQFPDLKIDTLKKAINSIYLEIYLKIQDKMHPKDIIKIINQVIFEEFKFESNIKNFHSPSNSMFNLVLDQKKGNPVALACIYILLAQKLDLPIYGVNLPNLFVLIFDFPGYKFYVNAFNKGQIFNEHDIDDYLKQMKIDTDEKYYNACNNQDIVQRILTNLSFAYSKIGEEGKQQEINELLDIFKQH